MAVPVVGDIATLAMASTIVNNSDELCVALSAQAAGTTVYGPFYNPKKALRLQINVAAIGGGSLTVTLLGYDCSSGATWTVIASAAIAATGLTRIEVGPYIAAAANAIAQDYPPALYQVQCVVATGPVTATIGTAGIGA
jgi:hypothetical protein